MHLSLLCSRGLGEGPLTGLGRVLPALTLGTWRFFYSGGATGKEPACQCTRDRGSIPGLGRSPGGGHGKPLQYSCLENPMGRGAWQATVHGVAKSRTRLSD